MHRARAILLAAAAAALTLGGCSADSPPQSAPQPANAKPFVPLPPAPEPALPRRPAPAPEPQEDAAPEKKLPAPGPDEEPPGIDDEQEVAPRLQRLTDEFAAAVRRSPPADLTDVWISAEPRPTVSVGIAGELPAAEADRIRRLAPPALLPYVDFVRMPRSSREIDLLFGRLVASLQSVEQRWIGGYDLDRRAFVVMVEDAGTRAQIASLLPDLLRRETMVEIARLPRITPPRRPDAEPVPPSAAEEDG